MHRSRRTCLGRLFLRPSRRPGDADRWAALVLRRTERRGQGSGRPIARRGLERTETTNGALGRAGAWLAAAVERAATGCGRRGPWLRWGSVEGHGGRASRAIRSVAVMGTGGWAAARWGGERGGSLGPRTRHVLHGQGRHGSGRSTGSGTAAGAGPPPSRRFRAAQLAHAPEPARRTVGRQRELVGRAGPVMLIVRRRSGARKSIGRVMDGRGPARGASARRRMAGCSGRAGGRARSHGPAAGGAQARRCGADWSSGEAVQDSGRYDPWR